MIGGWWEAIKPPWCSVRALAAVFGKATTCLITTSLFSFLVRFSRRISRFGSHVVSFHAQFLITHHGHASFFIHLVCVPWDLRSALRQRFIQHRFHQFPMFLRKLRHWPYSTIMASTRTVVASNTPSNLRTLPR